MARFILVCFAFLAFAFYELSGGSDFDPEETRLARIDPPSDVRQQPLERTQVAQAQIAPAPALSGSEDVTRVSLSLTSVEDVVRPAKSRSIQAKRVVAVQNAVSEEEPTIIIPSLIVDKPVITPVSFGQRGEEPREQAQGDFDVRAVTGSSVNVRGGPGTGYSVVNRLVRGDKVEILDNPGNGWVQMRPVGGGTTGWMADFLLSDG